MADDKKLPTWDGDHDKFNDYRRRCEWYLNGLRWSERSLAPSRLGANLTGKAWQVLENITPEVQADFDGPV